MAEPKAASAAARESPVPEDDAEEQMHSYSRHTLVCQGGNYALPQNALHHMTKLPSTLMPALMELKGYALPWVIRLLHEVYGSVVSARSGHIDWAGIAQRMEAHRQPVVTEAAAFARAAFGRVAAAAEHSQLETGAAGGESRSQPPATIPPKFTAQSVHQLWKQLAYHSGLNGMAVPASAAADGDAVRESGAEPSSDSSHAVIPNGGETGRPEQPERKRRREEELVKVEALENGASLANTPAEASSQVKLHATQRLNADMDGSAAQERAGEGSDEVKPSRGDNDDVGMELKGVSPGVEGEEEGEKTGVFFGEPPLDSLRGSATAAWMRHGEQLQLRPAVAAAPACAQASVGAPLDSAGKGAAPRDGDDDESDVEGFLQAQQRRVLEFQSEPKRPDSSSKRPALWPPCGTPRVVGRPYPAWPGVLPPTLPEDGSGPMNLGVEPPRKKGSAAAVAGQADSSDAYTLKEALHLKVQAKP